MSPSCAAARPFAIVGKGRARVPSGVAGVPVVAVGGPTKIVLERVASKTTKLIVVGTSGLPAMSVMPEPSVTW